MAHAIEHSKSSCKRWGGIWKDYIALHEFLDETKYSIGNNLHRMFRHNMEIIPVAEKIFGRTIFNSDGKDVYVKYIIEEHIKEDCNGYLPTMKEWLIHVQSGKPAPWMLKTLKIEQKGNLYEETGTDKGEV